MTKANQDAEMSMVALQRSNVALSRTVKQLRRKLDLMQSALLGLHGMQILSMDSPYSELAPIETRFLNDSDTTLLIFGGMLTKLGMPPREFFKALSDYRCNMVFVKDFAQSWYHEGLLGLSKNIQQTETVLRDLIPANTRRIMTIGTSSGGFASIHFGVKLGARKVLAFGPQTCVRIDEFRKFGSVDSRSENFNFSALTADLNNLWDEKVGKNFPGVKIIFSADNSLDRWHAERLAGKYGVELIELQNSTDHNSAGTLKLRGELSSVLDKFME